MLAVILLDIIYNLAIYWIMLLFIIAAIVRANHKDVWVWYIIGVALCGPVTLWAFLRFAEASESAPTPYWITYIAITLLSSVIIGIRRHRRDQEEPEPIFSRQDKRNSQWGYDRQTPVATSNIPAYLSSLRTQDGESITWVHDGAMTVEQVYGLKEVIVDTYKGYSETKPGSALFRLYITQAHKQVDVAPKGLVLGDGQLVAQENISSVERKEPPSVAKSNDEVIQTAVGNVTHNSAPDTSDPDVLTHQELVCPICGRKVPDYSKICLFCGPSASQALDARAGEKAEKKKWIVFVASAAVLAAICVAILYRHFNPASPSEVKITGSFGNEITNTIALNMGEERKLFWTITSPNGDTPKDANKIEWTSSDPSVVTVSPESFYITVTAGNAGTAIVSATISGVEKDSITIIVQPTNGNSDLLTGDASSETSRADKLLEEMWYGYWFGDTNTNPVVVARPQNGEIVYQKSGTSTSITGPLEVETSGTNDYFIKLRYHSTGEEVLSFYVHGGSSVEVEVPLGNYDITYACGDAWYGPEALFGENTSCYKADSTFDFYEEGGYVNGWTLTLYPVVNGNLDTDRIDISDF